MDKQISINWTSEENSGVEGGSKKQEKKKMRIDESKGNNERTE